MIYVHWSKRDDGALNIWVNNQRKVAYRGKTLSEERVYFKYGIYRSFLSRGKTPPPTQVVYYDRVSRSLSREDVE